MHYAAKNLLYTFNQSLAPRFATTGLFKRYARSPENRTFKKYFNYVHPGDCFIPYLRKRAHFSLSRYITIHKRKNNPVLCSNLISNLMIKMTEFVVPILAKKTRRPEASCEDRRNDPTKKTQNKPISRPIEVRVYPEKDDKGEKMFPLTYVPEGTKPNSMLIRKERPIELSPN